jgi:hypothetical protein
MTGAAAHAVSIFLMVFEQEPKRPLGEVAGLVGLKREPAHGGHGLADRVDARVQLARRLRRVGSAVGGQGGALEDLTPLVLLRQPGRGVKIRRHECVQIGEDGLVLALRYAPEDAADLLHVGSRKHPCVAEIDLHGALSRFARIRRIRLNSS